MAQYSFEKTEPENAGVNSLRIINFIRRLERCGLDMHSVLLLKDKKLIFEGYYAPFERDTLHRMFSITKSFVSLAVGILAGRGEIDLDASITEYFPEYEPDDGFHPYLKETTIRDMLSMTTPHNGTTFDKLSRGDWTESYFKKAPTHRPGTIFSYDTSASHTLAALVEKLTGKPLLDFLRDSGFREKGFSEEAYCVTDGAGVSQGGSGLMAKPLDILLAADIVFSGGEGIVPKSYIDEAVSYHVPNFVKGSFIEEKQGYGYQFWRVRHGGYMMYGMAGQLAVCMPDKNLILVTTADLTDRKDGMQLLFEAFWEELYLHIGEDLFSKHKKAELKELLNGLEIKPLESKLTRVFNGEYEFKDENPLGLTKLKISISESFGEVVFVRGGDIQKIVFGMGSMQRGVFNRYNCPYTASGMWADNDTLAVRANLIGECIGKVIMQFSLKKENAVTVFSRKTEETLFREYAGFAQGSKCGCATKDLTF